jgi:glycosyltransferase involved in cell wall biosynthesis
MRARWARRTLLPDAMQVPRIGHTSHAGGSCERIAEPRVVIVAEHASARFGGEAILPLHYFRRLRRLGVEAWLVVHSRTRKELETLLPEEADRMYFTRDTWLHVALAWCADHLPDMIAAVAISLPLQLLTQLQERPIVRKLVREKRATVIHQPIPVSPKFPSAMFGFGVPVVVGPMNGGMTYPWTRDEMKRSRAFGHLLNRFIPGKLRAATLLVANQRTRDALPNGVTGRIVELVENAVDLDLWNGPSPSPRTGSHVRFVFVGRLLALKCVDVLLEAFARVLAAHPARLTIIGDGAERDNLEALVDQLELRQHVVFEGWISQAECADRLRSADVMVFPSIRECGGAVVLEAMAMGIPVIATNWGGPKDYLDPSCGILIDPISRQTLVDGFVDAMMRLAGSEDLRRQLGNAGRQRVLAHFNWETKTLEMMNIYREAISRSKDAAGMTASRA